LTRVPDILYKDVLYKVVEVSPLTEESIEGVLNERTEEGWGFESIHFVMRDGSHRPAMAYLFFTRSRPAAPSGHDPHA
jgi:hypothetical protein